MNSVIDSIYRLFHNHSFGVLLIRIAIGVLFFTHGLMKVQSLSMAMAMFVHFGFFPWVGFIIAWLEVIGGLALILGVGTRLFAFLFGVEMLVATFLIGFSRGIGIEFVLAFVSFGLALVGPGRFSVYRMKRRGVVISDGSETVLVVE